MTKKSSLNVLMLIFSLGAAIAVYVLGEVLLKFISYMPPFIQCGIYLVFVAVFVFFAMYISEQISTGNYIQRGKMMFNRTCVKAAAILLPCAFLLGMLTQLLYGVIGIGSMVKPDFLGSMIVCDISGSMISNDPEYEAIEAIAEYIDTVEIGEYLGLIVYSSDYVTVREYSELQSEKERTELISFLRDNIEYDGGTETQAALLGAMSQIREIEDETWPGLIMLFSDGIASIDYNEIQRMSMGDTKNPKNSIPVSTIYFGDVTGGYQMSLIAQKTGGNYYYLEVDEDSSALKEAFTKSRSSFRFEKPHLLNMYTGPARMSVLRIILQCVLLTLWGAFTAVAVVTFLNNSQLFTAFIIPRLIVSLILSVAFSLILTTMKPELILPSRLLIAIAMCLIYIPTYQKANVR